MKRILILGASEFQIPVVQQAKEMGLHVGIVDIDKQAPSIRYADEYFQCSIKDKIQVYNIAESFKPDAVLVGICDSAMNTGAFICEKLGLPGTPTSVAFCATNKYEMIRAFERNGVPHPQYSLVQGNVSEYVHNIPYPVICKPVDSAGSKGINIANNYAELYSSLNDTIEYSDASEVLVEEYLEGPEISVELLVENGIPSVLQVTDKITTGAPHFVEIGHTQPSALSEDILNQVKQIACNAAVAVGLQNCIGHAELKVTHDGPKMIEIAGRLGGDAIAEQLIQLSTGINLPEAAILFSLGEKRKSFIPYANRFSAIRFIMNKIDGTITRISGLEKAKQVPYIEFVGCPRSVGDVVSNHASNANRTAYVISCADSRQKAIDACEQALQFIEIDVKPKS